MLVVDGIFVVQFYSWFLYLSLKKKKKVGEGEGGMTMDCGIVFIELNFSLTTLDFFFFYLWKQERDGRSEQKSNSDFFKSCFGRICKIIANFPLKYISAFWMMILVIWAWKIWDQTQCSCWAQSKAVAGVLHGFLTSTLGSELHVVYWYGADTAFLPALHLDSSMPKKLLFLLPNWVLPLPVTGQLWQGLFSLLGKFFVASVVESRVQVKAEGIRFLCSAFL